MPSIPCYNPRNCTKPTPTIIFIHPAEEDKTTIISPDEGSDTSYSCKFDMVLAHVECSSISTFEKHYKCTAAYDYPHPKEEHKSKGTYSSYCNLSTLDNHIGYASVLRYIPDEATVDKKTRDHAPSSLTPDSTLKEGHVLVPILELTCEVVEKGTTDKWATVSGGADENNSS